MKNTNATTRRVFRVVLIDRDGTVSHLLLDFSSRASAIAAGRPLVGAHGVVRAQIELHTVCKVAEVRACPSREVPV